MQEVKTVRDESGRIAELREIRAVNHSNVNLFRCYILQIKGEQCESCGATKKLEIHHKRYALDVCLADLAVLCHDCHHSISDFRNFDHPERVAA